MTSKCSYALMMLVFVVIEQALALLTSTVEHCDSTVDEEVV
jgi:hypothetical protein